MNTTIWNDLLNEVRVTKESVFLIYEKYYEEWVLHYRNVQERDLKKILISELNYEIRKTYKSSELVGFKVKPGDVCYMDFGKVYINEAGFQHFGLVLTISNSKAFVIPMTSNASTYNQSYCETTYPCGKKHLMRLPDIEGLHKKSVLFLNDAKFINTARVIEVKGCIDPESDLFQQIKKRVKECINL